MPFTHKPVVGAAAVAPTIPQTPVSVVNGAVQVGLEAPPCRPAHVHDHRLEVLVGVEAVPVVQRVAVAGDVPLLTPVAGPQTPTAIGAEHEIVVPPPPPAHDQDH